MVLNDSWQDSKIVNFIFEKYVKILVNKAYMMSRNLCINVYDLYVEGQSRHVRSNRQATPAALTPRLRSSHTCMAVRCPDACGQTDLSMRTDMATLTFHIRVTYTNLLCGRQTPIIKFLFF